MHDLTAYELNHLFQSEQVSAVEVTQYFLKRAKEANRQLGCYLVILEEQALEKAHLLDKKKQLGQLVSDLACIPYSVKDNIHIQGQKTTCASQFLQNFYAPFTASCVKFLDQAGAICIGKTNLDECAMGSSTETSAFKATSNPWNVAYSPGGSSGGSAASLASRSVLLSLGSDTGGSTRQPAAFNHLLGLKPSQGFFSRYGLCPLASSFDEISPMTLSSLDMAILCNHLSQTCTQDPFFKKRAQPLEKKDLEKPLTGKIIGVPWDFIKNVHPYVLKSFQQSLQIFQSLGVNIVSIDLKNLEYSLPIYQIMSCQEAFGHFAKFDGINSTTRSLSSTTTQEIYTMSRSEGFGKEVKQRLMLGAHILSLEKEKRYYQKAQKGRQILKKNFEEAFEDCHVIAMPTTASSAFKKGSIQDPLHMYLQDLYTICANITELPALSIPMGFCQENLPLGLQLMAPKDHESTLLNFSHIFEKQTKFTHLIPALFKSRFP